MIETQDGVLDMLYRAILADPNDLTARLAYADALEERGVDPDRSQFIRKQIKLQKIIDSDSTIVEKMYSHECSNIASVREADKLHGECLHLLLGKQNNGIANWKLWLPFPPSEVYGCILHLRKITPRLDNDIIYFRYRNGWPEEMLCSYNQWSSMSMFFSIHETTTIRKVYFDYYPISESVHYFTNRARQSYPHVHFEAVR